MPDPDVERPFRAFLGTAMVAATIAFLIFVRRARGTGQRLTWRDMVRADGPVWSALFHVTVALTTALLVVYVDDPRWLAWSHVPLPAGLRWAGAAVLAAALAWLFWAMQALGGNYTITPVTKSGHELVTGGPFRWVRHPMYSTVPMSLVGVPLLTANWLLAVPYLALLGLVLARVRREEGSLAETFGHEYGAYARRAGRLLPKPWAARSAKRNDRRRT